VGTRADLDGQREANISYHNGLRNPESLARSKSLYRDMSDFKLLLLELKIKNPNYRQCIVNFTLTVVYVVCFPFIRYLPTNVMQKSCF
jgi:hypothetical protein